ncbi:MAG: hypothetical protein HZA94_02035 [Candidatus Vogelbacteria bacterium]|nr:hypothetical protein [Candidatus Vogelbacteria bacterium]
MMKKIILWGLAIVVLLFILITALGYFEPQYREYKYNLAVKEADRIIKANEDAFRNDRDGGKTPEETFDLFLTALRAGNIELASKYYELPSQPKALRNLMDYKTSNSFALVMDNLNTIRAVGIKDCYKNYSGVEGCTFKNAENKHLLEFAINPNTNVWKIIQP